MRAGALFRGGREHEGHGSTDMNASYRNFRARARRRFKDRLDAPKSLLHFLIHDGAISEAQAWDFYFDAFCDGDYDAAKSRRRIRRLVGAER